MKSVIIGAGRYGSVYSYYLQEIGVNIVGFLDDTRELQNKSVNGIKVLGGTNLLPKLKENYDVEAIYCPLGNNKARVRFLAAAKKFGYLTPSFIHSSIKLPSNVVCGEGVYMLPNVQVHPFVRIDDYVMISTSVNIAHHSHLKKGVFMSTGVNFGAGILAGDYSYIGIGSTIMTGVQRIGINSLIGAGAVVIKDVPDNCVVVGVPAKIIKTFRKEE